MMPIPIRVLIADDEPPARQRLRQLLVAHPAFAVVGEAGSGTQTMALVAALQPDLLLLDIQMANGTGLDVAASLREPRPTIIFCTAFDQHAVDAFELNAVDYLLKPVSRSRLEKALTRIATARQEMTENPVNKPIPDGQQRLSRFLVHSEERYLVIGANEICYLEAVDGLTRLITKTGKAYWMDPSLQEISERVDPNMFFRISRAALVNVNTIAEVHPFPGGSAAVKLKDGTTLEVSRRRVKELMASLERG